MKKDFCDICGLTIKMFYKYEQDLTNQEVIQVNELHICPRCNNKIIKYIHELKKLRRQNPGVLDL